VLELFCVLLLICPSLFFFHLEFLHAVRLLGTWFLYNFKKKVVTPYY
jgi:hypothetical protein